MTCLTLTTGTAFIMWVGEQIVERGIETHSLSAFAESSSTSPPA